MNDTATASSDARLRRLAPFLLVAVALLTLLPANHLLPLIDRDEPRFAQATREMIQRGEWVVPYFNEEYRFDKPILIYWMMRASYAVFGQNEFAARIPSVLSTILLALIVLKMGTRWFSRRAGFFAALGLLTSVQILMHGRSAVADMPMVAMVALAQFAAFELIHDNGARYPWRWFWTLYISLGLGFLAKGPVALVVPLLTLPVYRFLLWRKPLRWRRLRLLPGLLIVMALMGAWGIPALVKTGGEFWTVGMKSHVWERGFETFQGHGSFFLYYVVIALLSLFPWSAYLGDGITIVKRHWTERNAFLVSWLLCTYVLFSFYRTKLPHYVMPSFAAFFLIVGQTADLAYESPKWARRWFWFTLSLFGIVSIAALVAAALVSFPPAYAGLRLALAGGGGIFLSLAALAILWRGGWIRYAGLPVAGIAISVTLLGTGLRSTSPSVKLTGFFAQMPAETVYGFHGFKEPSLVFYSNHRWIPLDTENLNAFLAGPGPRVLVFQDQEIRIDDFLESLLPDETGRRRSPKPRDSSAELDGVSTDGYEEMTVEGINIARTSTAKLRVFYRPL